MDLEGQRESSNVEDRRALTPGRLAIGGGAGLLIAVVVFLLSGGDVGQLLNQIQNNPPQGAPQGGPVKLDDPAEEKLVKFVKMVLASTEDVWNKQFEKMDKRYREPKLVLFRGRVDSACGSADAAMGPFYCPPDERLYLDLSFFDDMRIKLKAPGDFAQAYVIAHEVGHHVQKLLGYTDKVHEARGRLSTKEYNKLSVRLELQADFLAGFWAHHANKARRILEPGDLEEALNAANAIGDDRLQQQGRGTVVPDSFTHGTSAQRIRWFRLGFTTGDMRYADTFSLRDDEL